VRFRFNPKTFVGLAVLILLAVAPRVHAVSGTNQISAANIDVVQNDTANTSASVTLSTPVSINDFRVINGTQSSRGDYFVQIGASATDDVTNGILISCIAENGRDNGETGNYYGVNFGTSAIDSGASGSPGSSGQWWIPVFQAPTDGEYNFNVSAAYFPYSEGWLGGWLVNSTGVNGGANNRLIGNPSLQLGTHVIDQGSGKTTVDLRAFGINSQSNAVLLAVGGKNEANFALVGDNTNGTWTVSCRDDNGGGEQDYVGFVCVPLTNHTVVSGKFRGNAAIVLKSETFAVTSIGVGTYHLTIPGVNPTNGVLIVSAEGGDTNNVDNIVSYQLKGDGWDIQTRDITTDYPPALQQLLNTDDVTSFVFIPAPAPLSLTWVGSPQTTWSQAGDTVWRQTGTNIAASYTDTNVVVFDDSASNFVVTVTGTVSPVSMTVSNALHNYTLSGTGTISGATGLTKRGVGTLLLGTINDYTGDTTIVQGAVALASSRAIPGGSNAGNVIVNGTLNLGGYNCSPNNLSGGGVINNTGGASTLTVNAITNTTFTGLLGNGSALSLFVTGGGVFTVTGNDSFTGAATISNATLAVNGPLTANHVDVLNGGTLAGTGVVNCPVICADGSSLALSPADPLIVNSITLNGSVNVRLSSNISLTNTAQYVLLQHGGQTAGVGSFTLTQPPGLQCNGFKALLIDSGGQLKLVVTNAPLTGTIADVRHVVLLMNENRSYDHYFGTLHGGRGFDDRNAMLLTTGLDAFHQPTSTGFELPFHSSEQCLTDLNHTWPVTHDTFNNGRSDQWIPNKTPETMVYYTRDDLPFYYQLADAFTVCDEYHASVISSTFPNRFMYMTGTIDPHSKGGGPEIDNSTFSTGFSWKTYPEFLQDAGVDWKIYQVSSSDGDNITQQFANFKKAKAGNPLYDRGMVMAANVDAMIALFKKDVTNNTLPDVSWIIGPGAYSEHPPNSPANGEILTKAILDAIASNPTVYNSTVYIVNYDENDGFFDHAMPILPPQGAADEFVGNMPIGLGVRVPCILASPWSRGGRVCSQVFDHTSTLQFLEQWTGVKCPNISDWRRQVCGDLTSAFDFAHPDFSYPGASFTDPTYTSCPSGTTVAPPAMQTMPTQEPGTLTPLPLPYQPNAFCTLNSSANTLTVTMTNSGPASVHFGVYPNTYSTATPQPFDVPNATSASTTFSLSASAGKYDYSCYGPDGFQRRFAGNLSSDYNKIEATAVLNQTNGTCLIALQNLSSASVIFTGTNGYRNQTANYSVPAHSTVLINVGSETNNGLYDVTITSSADALFLRRFLGRAQTILPPALPAPIVLGNPAVTNGKFQFNFTGPVGQTYKVLVTTDAADSSSWQMASYGIFDNSPAVFTETNNANSTRFYRVVAP
jgi:phospholipase C